MADLELIPPEEAAQIADIVNLTIHQLKRRYEAPGGKPPVLRGVHAKDHGCVRAKFKVIKALPNHLRVGIFANPGQEYDAWIRFSNASVSVDQDSRDVQGVRVHGSRGMAVKVLGVTGSPLVPTDGPLTQDFLMINSPVFAFSNVEDYQALSQAIKDADDPRPFFARMGMAAPISTRAQRTKGIFDQIQSNTSPPGFQAPPASPVDNRYFSAAPFLFGDDRVMKYSARPIAPVAGGPPDITDRDYLRKALQKRLTAPGAQGIVFDFQVQLRSANELAGKIATEIEDACVEWPELEDPKSGKLKPKYPFETVARITIPPQDFDTQEQREVCESLTFTPWHGIAEHRPIGGINRLRLAVYEASTEFRHKPEAVPAEPAHL